MTTTEIGTLPAGDYRIDPARSTVTFTTRHVFGLASVRGTLRLRDGHLHVAEPPAESSAQATISVTSFDTGNSLRDNTVRSAQYLDAEAHPAIVFASTGLEDADGHWVLHGSLTVRGLTRGIEVRIDAAKTEGSGVRVGATGRVDRYEFGVTKMKGMTGRWLTVRLDLVAVLSGK
jgi:polyisoprenoid-binding protein YceI